MTATHKSKQPHWNSGFYADKSKRVTANQMLLWEESGAKIEVVFRNVERQVRGPMATTEHVFCMVSNAFDSAFFRCTDYQFRLYISRKINAPEPLSPSELKCLEKIEKSSSWVELFGSKAKLKRAEYRKSAWEQWKKCYSNSRSKGGGDAFLEAISGIDCNGCVHKNGDWCSHMNLPCVCNLMIPGRIGMACKGIAFTPSPRQDNNHPA